MRTLSAKVLNAIEQKIKQIESVTGPITWVYTPGEGDELISVRADNLSDEQDLSLTELNIWNEMLVTNEVSLSPWSDANLVSLNISVDIDELEDVDVKDLLDTIKKRFSSLTCGY